jgi:hypothetical protein
MPFSGSIPDFQTTLFSCCWLHNNCISRIFVYLKDMVGRNGPDFWANSYDVPIMSHSYIPIISKWIDLYHHWQMISVGFSHIWWCIWWCISYGSLSDSNSHFKTPLTPLISCDLYLHWQVIPSGKSDPQNQDCLLVSPIFQVLSGRIYVNYQVVPLLRSDLEVWSPG